MVAAARTAFASCGRLHLLLPSSSSPPILARTRVSCGGRAKPISFLAPSSAARSTKNSVLFCSCSSSSSHAPVAPPPQAVEEEKKPAPAAGEEKGEVSAGELVGLLDIRVGRVVKAWWHPETDTLYVEEVDVGEDQPRTICSGLINYLPLDELQHTTGAAPASFLSCRGGRAASFLSHLTAPPSSTSSTRRPFFPISAAIFLLWNVVNPL